VLLLLYLQTKASGYQNPAKGTTTREFQDIMKIFVPDATARMQKYGLKPLFSWDNNRIQASASLRAMGLREEQKVPLPAYSPDMHKVIEHVFAHVKRAVQDALKQSRTRPLDADDARQLVEVCFRGATTESIMRDVLSLRETYFVIAHAKGITAVGLDGEQHTGVGGDWPPNRYR
jgi:hypothetical protein